VAHIAIVGTQHIGRGWGHDWGRQWRGLRFDDGHRVGDRALCLFRAQLPAWAIVATVAGPLLSAGPVGAVAARPFLL
jgi:hypothetical protein